MKIVPVNDLNQDIESQELNKKCTSLARSKQNRLTIRNAISSSYYGTVDSTQINICCGTCIYGAPFIYNCCRSIFTILFFPLRLIIAAFNSASNFCQEPLFKCLESIADCFSKIGSIFAICFEKISSLLSLICLDPIKNCFGYCSSCCEKIFSNVSNINGESIVGVFGGFLTKIKDFCGIFLGYIGSCFGLFKDAFDFCWNNCLSQVLGLINQLCEVSFDFIKEFGEKLCTTSCDVIYIVFRFISDVICGIFNI